MVLGTIFQLTGPKTGADTQVVYSQFMLDVKNGKVDSVYMDGRTLIVKPRDSKSTYVTVAPLTDFWLVSDMLKYGVKVDVKPEERPSLLKELFWTLLPFLLLIGFWVFFMKQMQGGGKGGGPFSFGKSKAVS